MTIRGHFNGTSIVLDEPADLPLNESLELEIKRRNGVSPAVAAAMEAAKDPAVKANRLEAFAQFRERVRTRPAGPRIPAEALRREYIYGDDGR